MSDEDRPRLRLKNGAEVDAQIAYVKWHKLAGMLQSHPQDLNLLVTLASGTANTAPISSRQYLRRVFAGWFDHAGELIPIARDVITSAARDTPDGLTIVNPFDLRTQKDIDTLANVAQRVARIMDRLLRGDFGPDERSIS